MVFQQRNFHFYCLNELIHLGFLLTVWSYSEPLEHRWVPMPTLKDAELAWTSYVLRLICRFVLVCISYALFNGLNFAGMAAFLLFRRQFRASSKVVGTVAKEGNIHNATPDFEVFEHTTHDGVKLRVLCTKRNHSGGGSQKKKGGKGKDEGTADQKVMLIGLPLGQKGETSFQPVYAHFGSKYIYVTWHYRGFHSSADPSNWRRMGIPYHAMDAKEVLNACGYEYADVMIGHSMGCAVAFETVLLYPTLVGSLIIMNGFHGHVFNTALQPFARLPFSHDCVSGLVEFLLAHPTLLESARRVIKPCLDLTLPLYARWAGSKLMKKIHGERYFLNFMNNYSANVFSSPRNTVAWLRMFQELDAHSVYHLLPTIKQPTLLISGLMDTITPAQQSVEIARRIPHSVHYCDISSTHCTILESPEWTVAEIQVFLEGVENKKKA